MGAAAVPGGEVCPVGESGDVADLDQQACGAGGADAVQVHQSGAGGGEQFLEFFVSVLGTPVDPFEVADQFRGDPTSCFTDGVARSHLGEHGLCLGRGEVLLRPAGDELAQQLVQLGDHTGVILTERPAAVDQDPQQCEPLIVDHRSKTGQPGADQGDRVPQDMNPGLCPPANRRVSAGCVTALKDGASETARSGDVITRWRLEFRRAVMCRLLPDW